MAETLSFPDRGGYRTHNNPTRVSCPASPGCAIRVSRRAPGAAVCLRSAPCPASASSSPPTRCRGICVRAWTRCSASRIGGPRADRRRRLLAGRVRRDHRRVRGPRPAVRARAPAPRTVRPRAGAQRRRRRGPPATTCSSWTATTTSPPARSPRSPTGWRATGDPDVLLYDHDADHGLGAGERAATTADFLRARQAGTAPFRLDGPPRAAAAAPGRLEQGVPPRLLDRRGPRLRRRAPTRTSRWTYPALLAAGPIACLDRVCVHLPAAPPRQRSSTTPGRHHFDVFDQYDRLFAVPRPSARHGRPGGRCCSAGWPTSCSRPRPPRPAPRRRPRRRSCAGPAPTTAVTAPPAGSAHRGAAAARAAGPHGACGRTVPAPCS